MTLIDLVDYKGDTWQLFAANKCTRYLHKGQVYWQLWWYAPVRPHALRNYNEVPLPVFADWWCDNQTWEAQLCAPK